MLLHQINVKLYKFMDQKSKSANSDFIHLVAATGKRAILMLQNGTISDGNSKTVPIHESIRESP